VNNMKISYMGSGTPILTDKRGVQIPADRRVHISEAQNRNEQIETIAFQRQLMELERRR